MITQADGLLRGLLSGRTDFLPNIFHASILCVFYSQSQSHRYPLSTTFIKFSSGVQLTQAPNGRMQLQHAISAVRNACLRKHLSFQTEKPMATGLGAAKATKLPPSRPSKTNKEAFLQVFLECRFVP